jgi:ribosomal protein L11 methylase PrmA
MSMHGVRHILEAMETQLRDYRIRPGHMDDWIAGWTTGIVPLRHQEGFTIVGAWVDRPHDRFVWLVGYSGADGFEAAEERYHDLPERLAIDPNPSDFIETATLDMVDRLP